MPSREVGDTLVVTDTSGRESRGRVIALSAATLELAAEGRQRAFTDVDLSQIRQRRGDSLRNGTLIGLGAGIGLGALCIVGAATEDDIGAGWTAVCLGTCAGLGAAIGVGIDAAIRGTQLIYARPGTAARGVHIRPLFGSGRSGVAASLVF